MTSYIDNLLSKKLTEYRNNPEIHELIKMLMQDRIAYSEQIQETFKNTVEGIIADFEKVNADLKKQLEATIDDRQLTSGTI